MSSWGPPQATKKPRDGVETRPYCAPTEVGDYSWVFSEFQTLSPELYFRAKSSCPEATRNMKIKLKINRLRVFYSEF
jgi:hypothetical protein